MGKILPSYKKAIYDEIVDNIAANTSNYYAFGANPVSQNAVPSLTNDDYSTSFTNDWQMLFGKKLTSSNILPMISRNLWTSNTLYERYDNTSNTLYTNNIFYAITEPATTGGSYLVYKCIDNANNSKSTVKPSSIGTPTQTTTFTTGDGYKWRYITSISGGNYDSFATGEYVPVYPNSSIVSSALNNSGVEVVMISNSGSGYSAYSNGTIKSNPNTTLIEIESTSSIDNDFYTKSAIYIYNVGYTTSQLFTVSSYVSNSSGKWVYLDGEANTTNITPSVTKYLITPAVVFDTDGTTPVAYATVNTSSNSINSVVILDIGANVSRANVVIQSNTSYGSGANLYAIVPPPGGHGSDPASELNMKALGINFTFANNEGNTILTSNVVYNKIGLIRNPYAANVSTGAKMSVYKSNTFSATLYANVSPSYTFAVGERVTGKTSGAKGTVALSNSTTVHLTGDKFFTDGEYLSNSSGGTTTTISINTMGAIYTKDLKPLYVQNINNINRSNTQTELFKLVVQV